MLGCIKKSINVHIQWKFGCLVVFDVIQIIVCRVAAMLVYGDMNPTIEPWDMCQHFWKCDFVNYLYLNKTLANRNKIALG